MKLDRNIVNESIGAAKNLCDFNSHVIESMQTLNWNWISLGFEDLNLEHTFIVGLLSELEFLPIREESLYSEKFLKELRTKEEWFRNNYKEETREIGRRILKKLNEISIQDEG